MQYRKHLIIFICLIPFSLCAQDITGLWKGTLYNDTTGQYYKYEIGISKEKGKLSGFSHTWFILDDKQYYGVKKVKVRIADDGKILVEDDGLIANNYPVAPNKNVRQLNILTLDASGSIMNLSGPFSTNRTKEYHSLTGSVDLQRKNDFWQSALVPHLQELGKDKELSFVKEEAETNERAERQRLLAQGELAKEKEAALTAIKTKTTLEAKAAEQDKQQQEAIQRSNELAAREKDNQVKQQAAEAERALLRKRAEEITIAEKDRKQAEANLQIETRLRNEKEELARKEEAKRLEAEKKDDERLAQKASLARTAAEKKLVALEKQQQEAEKVLQKEKADLLAKKEKEARMEAEKQQLALARAERQQKEVAQRDAEKQQILAVKEKQALAKAGRDQKELALKEAKKRAAEKERQALVRAELVQKETAEKETAEKEAEKQKNVAEELADIDEQKRSLLPQNAAANLATAPAQSVNERKTVLQQTVSFSSDSLMLSLYDNGEIDGDTVSVLMNGELILAKQGLSTNAIKKTIYIPANMDRVELIMYAESLGSIPPNTGLLVIRDGKSLYEIRFSGDLQKNASIVFNRRKE